MHAVKDGVLFEMRVNIYKTLAHTQKKLQNAFHIKCRQSPWHKRKLKNQLNAETHYVSHYGSCNINKLNLKKNERHVMLITIFLFGKSVHSMPCIALITYTIKAIMQKLLIADII